MSGPTTARVAANSMGTEQCIECNSVCSCKWILVQSGLAATGMEGNEQTLNMFTIDEGYYHFLLLLLDGNHPTTL